MRCFQAPLWFSILLTSPAEPLAAEPASGTPEGSPLSSMPASTVAGCESTNPVSSDDRTLAESSEAFVREFVPDRAHLGMRTTVVPDADHARAMEVVEVLFEGPAARHGLQVGDRILSIDGEPVSFENDLERVYAMDRIRAGDLIELEISRHGRIHSLSLRTEAMPEETQRYLLRWVAAAEERLALGKSLYCKEDDEDEGVDTSNPLPGWFASRPAERIVIRVVRFTAASHRISTYPQGLALPDGLELRHLKEFVAEELEALRPGQALDVTFRSIDEGRWKIEARVVEDPGEAPVVVR